VRLALLEHAAGRADIAEGYTRTIGTPEVQDALPRDWIADLGSLARLAPESQHGGAPLPIVAGGSPGRREGQGRERPRREPVRDREAPHDQ